VTVISTEKTVSSVFQQQKGAVNSLNVYLYMPGLVNKSFGNIIVPLKFFAVNILLLFLLNNPNKKQQLYLC